MTWSHTDGESEEGRGEEKGGEKEEVFVRGSQAAGIFGGDILADTGLSIYRLVPFSAW